MRFDLSLEFDNDSSLRASLKFLIDSPSPITEKMTTQMNDTSIKFK